MQGLSRKSWRKDSSLFASTNRRRMAFHKPASPEQPTVTSTDASKRMGAMMRELGV